MVTTENHRRRIGRIKERCPLTRTTSRNGTTQNDTFGYNPRSERVTWDPSQATATRPLAIQKDGTWFTYGYDITKNVCEVFGPAGYIRTWPLPLPRPHRRTRRPQPLRLRPKQPECLL